MLNQIPLDLSPLSDPKFYQYDLDIVASCHGFISLYYRSQHGDIYLWNPTTPSLSSSGLKPLPPVTPREKFDVEPYSVGVVFDPISNDFKVLRLLNVMYNENLKAEVYTKVLVRGDCLKIVEGFPHSFCPDFWNTVYMGGFFFWWTIDAGVESIVAFDFSEEVFILMTEYCCFRLQQGGFHTDDAPGPFCLPVFQPTHSVEQVFLRCWLTLLETRLISQGINSRYPYSEDNTDIPYA